LQKNPLFSKSEKVSYEKISTVEWVKSIKEKKVHLSKGSFSSFFQIKQNFVKKAKL